MGRFVRILTIAIVLLLSGCTSTPKIEPSASPIPSISSSPTSSPDDVQRPLPVVTPGVILATNKSDFCTPGWSSAHRKDLTAAEKRQLLKEYGLTSTTKVAEWDHLISLELGGGNGTKNIWPELDLTQKTRKDKLENQLHSQVCNGAMLPAVAQDEIKNFWEFW